VPVTQLISRSIIEADLAQRLRSAGAILLTDTAPPVDDIPARDAAVVLDLLVRAVQANRSVDRLWLLYTAVTGAFPEAEDVMTGLRFFELAGPVDATLWLLDQAAATYGGTGGVGQLRVVTDRVVVDVDHSARHDLHTGVQQVVRRTLPIWQRDRPMLAVAWTEDRKAWRSLTNAEQVRALRRGMEADKGGADPTPREIIVPWRTVVVLPEVPTEDCCSRLATLAEYSGNAVAAIGYDCIPAVSADLVYPVDLQRFCRYLTILKYARRIAAISHSATVEFGGFASALPAQGLRGPDILECSLPTQPLVTAVETTTSASSTVSSGAPLVVCVGSFEPRKNHLAVLYAAERLWRDGLAFELLFVAGSGWGNEIPAMISQLRAAGRPIMTRQSARDMDVAAAYRAARFSVFTSLHEGYGLPVAESLAFGTPVITSNYGGTAQIGADGGAVMIDPRDDEALVAAMRQLLTDDALLERLRLEIRARPDRTWEDYAADLWDRLVQPALEGALRGDGL
jgi:glycosyltransferase involved in cell wall biosynthesis